MARYPAIKGFGLFMLIFFWFLWFINFSIRTIFSPLMPLIEDEFAIRHAQAGRFFVFNALGYGIAIFLSGMLSGRFGYKRAILFSLFSMSGILFLIPFTNSFDLLCILSFFLGLASGIYLPSIIPLITHYFDLRTWGKAIAIHDSAVSFSIFGAPFMALVLLHYLPWKHVFIVFGIVTLINLVLFLQSTEELKIDRTPAKHSLSLLRERTLWIIILLWIFSSGANLGIYYITPLYLIKELHMDSVYANQIFGMSRIGGIFVAILVGFIIDRFNLKRTMFTLVFTTGILTLFLTFTHGRALEVFLFLQAAAGFGFFPVGLVAIAKMFDQDLRGVATGYIVTLGVIFGLGIIPCLLGVAGDYLSFRWGIFILGVLTIAASGLTYYLKEIDQ
ncbi:MAG: MFS transporter [Syntrophaceae bacterium]|nr:MFS transporter [Syntrophaceae bacterium]